jgi:hypothetical protein
MKTKGKINREDLIQILVKRRLEDKMSNYQMIDFIMTNYGYKQAYAYEIAREARLKIADMYKDWSEKLLEQTIGELEAQRREAKKANDRKLVLEITKEINKITGLYVERVEHSGSVEHKVDVIKIIAPPDGTSTESN